MNRRADDSSDIESIPSMTAGSATGEAYRRRSDTTIMTARGREARDAPRAAGTGWFVRILLVLLIAGEVAAGWYIIELRQDLAAASDIVEKTRTRIEVMEERLADTDTSVTQSGDLTRRRLDNLDVELRRLRDLAQGRNRPAIAANQQAIQAQRATLDALAADVEPLKPAVAQIAALETTVAEVGRLAGDLSAATSTDRQRLRDLADALGVLSQASADMERRVRDNEQAVAAIDAYRKQVNRTLAEIRARLDGTTPPAQ